MNQPCIVCQATTSAPFPADRRYVRCDECGSLRLADELDQRRANGLYGAGYFTSGDNDGYTDYGRDASLHLANGNDRLDDIEKVRGPGGGVMVDVGCAYGYTLDIAHARGWATLGVDVSPHAREVAATKGHKVFERLDAVPGPVDVVSFYQVLEHMVEPRLQLRAALDLVRPGGLLVLETWDASSAIARLSGKFWHQLSPPSVVHIWTKDSVRRMVEDIGFVEVTVARAAKQVNVAATMGLLAGKYDGVPGRAFSRVARSRLAHRPLRYGLGDLIKLAAVRP